MSEAFTAEDRKSIIITAVQVAGPGASDDAVSNEVKRIARLLGDTSPAHAAFHELDRQAEQRVGEPTWVPGTIVGFGKESLNKGVERGVIVLFTGVTEKNPDGKETFRSDILGSEGSEARALMKQVAASIGKKITLHKHLEKMAGSAQGHTVRVFRAIKVQGDDPQFDPGNDLYQPVWNSPDESTRKMLTRAVLRGAAKPEPAMV